MTTATIERPATRNASKSPTLDACAPRRNGRPYRLTNGQRATEPAAGITAAWWADQLAWVLERIGTPSGDLLQCLIEAAGHDFATGHRYMKAADEDLIGTLQTLHNCLGDACREAGLAEDSLELATLEACQAVLDEADNDSRATVLGHMHELGSQNDAPAEMHLAGMVLGCREYPVASDSEWREIWLMGVADIVRDLACRTTSRSGGETSFAEAAAMWAARLQSALRAHEGAR